MSQLTALEQKYAELGKEIELLKNPPVNYVDVVLPFTSKLFHDIAKQDAGGSGMTIRLYDASPTTLSYEEALKYAVDRGLRLMSKEEIHYLAALGILGVGAGSFWSASVVSSSRTYAWVFDGDGGISVDDRDDDDFYSARAVGGA